VTVPVVTIDAVNNAVQQSMHCGRAISCERSNERQLEWNESCAAGGRKPDTGLDHNAGVTLNTADGSVNVAAGTPAGNYTVTYQICDKLNPTICDTASVTVPVVTIDAVNNAGSTVNGTAGGQSLANVLTNDSLNGTSPVLLADVNLTQVSTTNAGVTLNTADGSVNVAAGTPAGNYTVTYQICDKLNPTICDTASVTVPVVNDRCVNNAGSTVNGTGGRAILLRTF